MAISLFQSLPNLINRMNSTFHDSVTPVDPIPVTAPAYAYVAHARTVHITHQEG